MDKNKIITIILVAVLIICGLSYFAYNKHQETELENEKLAFENGVGYAVLWIVQEVSNCRQVPLLVGDKTTDIIAVECLG